MCNDNCTTWQSTSYCLGKSVIPFVSHFSFYELHRRDGGLSSVGSETATRFVKVFQQPCRVSLLKTDEVDSSFLFFEITTTEVEPFTMLQP